MKKILSLILSVLMVTTALFALPFNAAAATRVSATASVNVSSWEELKAALTDGKGNKTIVLTKDIMADPRTCMITVNTGIMMKATG